MHFANEKIHVWKMLAPRLDSQTRRLRYEKSGGCSTTMSPTDGRPSKDSWQSTSSSVIAPHVKVSQIETCAKTAPKTVHNQYTLSIYSLMQVEDCSVNLTPTITAQNGCLEAWLPPPAYTAACSSQLHFVTILDLNVSAVYFYSRDCAMRIKISTN